jgi:hypothetical protein
MKIDIPKEISQATAAHCAALLYGTLSNFIWEGSHNFIEGQGTLTFVKYKGHLFGITNQHVVAQATEAYANQSEYYVFVAALEHHTRVPSLPIMRFTQDDADFPFDLAIFLLPSNFLEGSKKVPLDLDKYPSAPLQVDSRVLAVGFPGSQRKLANPRTSAHGLFHVVSTCISTSDRKIILSDTFNEEQIPHRFGGMSGGPMFSFGDEGGYEFQGILFLGKGFGDVDDNEAIGKEIWIWGFPFSGSMLERACVRAGFEF